MNDYEEKQRINRINLEQRYQHVYQEIPSYREIEDSISFLSISQARKALEGDSRDLNDYKREMSALRDKKRDLLLKAGLPDNYLDMQYHCSLCKDTGYLEHGEKCSCLKQSITSFLYDQSNLAKVIQTENFDHLSYEYFSGENLTRFIENVNTSKEFITNFDSHYQNLLFYGTVGTGKSFLSGCIAKSLIDSGHSVIYFSASGFFDLLSKYSFDFKNRDMLSELYDNLYSCDLLIIDDLGTELTNAFTTSQLFSCINERNLRKKPLLISTNLSFVEIRERYSDRIFSRITYHFKINKFTGPDIRVL